MWTNENRGRYGNDEQEGIRQIAEFSDWSFTRSPHFTHCSMSIRRYSVAAKCASLRWLSPISSSFPTRRGGRNAAASSSSCSGVNSGGELAQERAARVRPHIGRHDAQRLEHRDELLSLRASCADRVGFAARTRLIQLDQSLRRDRSRGPQLVDGDLRVDRQLLAGERGVKAVHSFLANFFGLDGAVDQQADIHQTIARD